MSLVPSDNARLLCQQIKLLNTHDLRYIRHYLTQLLDDDDDEEPGSGGVREPRRPIPPDDHDTIQLEYDDPLPDTVAT